MEEKIDNKISIDIFNSLGQIVFNSEESQPVGISSALTKEINLNNAASGVYFIEIKSEKKIVSRKILVTK
jgi:hypothetical protein